MHLNIHRDHRHARRILETEFKDEWGELLEVLGSTTPPLRAAHPFTRGRRPDTPKRHKTQRKDGAYRLLPIDQGELNQSLKVALRDKGWNDEPYAVDATVVGAPPSYLQGDFYKNHVFVEVEFGNSASLFRDLFKFQVAGQTVGSGQPIGEVGVLVVASRDMAKFFDSGVATFEQAERLLPYMQIGLSLPTAIVGLDLDAADWAVVRTRYEEMEEVATANEVACVTFDQMLTLPEPSLDDLLAE